MSQAQGNWAFNSNRSHTSMGWSRTPEATLCEGVGQIGIAQTRQGIVADTQESGAMDHQPRYPFETHHTIREVLGLVVEDQDP